MDAERSSKLTKEGITTADEIKDFTVLKNQHRNIFLQKQKASALLKEKLNAFLSEISTQFTTLTMKRHKALPPWDGTRPYQQVPFQYSLHILREPNSELEHHEYLHRDASNPMPSLIASLKENVSDEGSILVWYESCKSHATKRWRKCTQFS